MRQRVFLSAVRLKQSSSVVQDYLNYLVTILSQKDMVANYDLLWRFIHFIILFQWKQNWNHEKVPKYETTFTLITFNLWSHFIILMLVAKYILFWFMFHKELYHEIGMHVSWCMTLNSTNMEKFTCLKEKKKVFIYLAELMIHLSLIQWERDALLQYCRFRPPNLIQTYHKSKGTFLLQPW